MDIIASLRVISWIGFIVECPVASLCLKLERSSWLRTILVRPRLFEDRLVAWIDRTRPGLVEGIDFRFKREATREELFVLSGDFQSDILIDVKVVTWQVHSRFEIPALNVELFFTPFFILAARLEPLIVKHSPLGIFAVIKWRRLECWLNLQVHCPVTVI